MPSAAIDMLDTWIKNLSRNSIAMKALVKSAARLISVHACAVRVCFLIVAVGVFVGVFRRIALTRLYKNAFTASGQVGLHL